MKFSEMQADLCHFAAERDWQQFHTPKNLSTALMVEAAELAEIFQWMTPDQSLAAALDPGEKQRIGDEVADVLLYLLQLADHCQIDIAKAATDKLARIALKYPALHAIARVSPAHVVPGAHVLLDYENVQPTEEELRALAPEASQVWVFHGPHQRLEDQAAQDEIKAPPAPPRAKRQAVRQALPASLPRVERHHEIAATHCACGQALERIGQEVSEQLDCVPAQFFVLRHIRGKFACPCCQTIQAAPMPAQMIDKGIPAPGLLAQVVVAKHDDHLPLYRQTEIYARSGVHIPRSSMAQWSGICGVRLTPLANALKDFILGHDVIHADETPVKLLAPGKGKTSRAYVWVYRTTNFVAQRAVLYDFSAGRGGDNARRVLQGFGGTLVSDDFSGYHALQSQGVRAALCMAHARRKLFEAHQFNGSEIAGHAVALIAKLYEVEREAGELQPEARRRLRQQHAQPVANALHAWLSGQRQKLAKADVTAKAIDYSLSNWPGLTHYLDDGHVPIDNNAAENAVRPLAVGRKNWLFVGSQQAGERAAVVLSLIESAKLNGHDPWAYLKDVFERLPTLKQRDLAQLLPHTWRPSGNAAVVESPPVAVVA